MTDYNKAKEAIEKISKIAKENNMRFEASTMINGGMSYRIAVFYFDEDKRIFSSVKGIHYPFLHTHNANRKVLKEVVPHLEKLQETKFFQGDPMIEDYNDLTDVFQ